MDVPDHPSAAVLRDGDRVLVLGGREGWIFEKALWRRGPPLPYSLGHPRAWLAGERIFVAGRVELDYILLELSAELGLVQEHTFRWPPPSLLHVDRRGKVWGMVDQDLSALSGALACATILVCPCSYPSVHELRDGTLLVWATGGADHPQPRGTRLWRLGQDGRWEQMGVVPSGGQGLTGLSLELERGELLLLTVRGEIALVEPQTGQIRILVLLDQDKSAAFWAGGCLVDAGEGQILAFRPGEARRVDLATGEVQLLCPPQQARVGGEGVWDPDGQLWLVGGFGTRKQGLPPERFSIVPLLNPKRRRPSAIQVVIPEGPLLIPEVGEKVRIKSGSFTDMVGTVLRSDSEKLLVELTLFGRLLSVQIPLSDTESL